MASLLPVLQCSSSTVSASSIPASSLPLTPLPNTASISSSSSPFYHKSFRLNSLCRIPFFGNSRTPKLTCRAAEYKFPDPIPEFAEAETEKFRTHLLDKLSKKDIFGDEVEEVVEICTQIIDNFFHTEYGGPGTLLVDPFMEMAETINEQGLPGGPQAARAAIKWAQNHLDKDWKEWTGK
ncbi:OLC1v1033339C1 [Oldenlandia corymbosa var. corymbosa]|uniref:OLC1v1033339C1 n=1 Tax=Oldenlandia corymbosa var. corymbosa TaxID=529605 RepID=A0AAV1CNU9_OLDCO|nr:OLC1v1033339C1 [Oldenlandia corymbosa var. corymbosa]